MRKAPLTTAALAAAFLVLALPASLEAARSRGKSRSGRALPQSASAKPKAEAERPAARDPFAPGYLKGGPAARSPKRPARPAPRVVQESSGEVVLETVEVHEIEPVREPLALAETASTAAGEAAAAPSDETALAVAVAVPEESFDYPQPPCPPEDPVIEAHVHVADAETPEKPDPDVVASKEPAPGIKRLARRLGSLFRPKSAAARVRPRDVDLSELLSENFQIPVEGVDRNRLRDSFLESRGRYARHLAIDIGAPRGTPILATTDGEIVKLMRDGRAGIAIHQKDSSGRYLFFYCHLSRYARGLSVGKKVSKGEVIGYVGATGRVIGGPHLHFSITRLPEDDDNHREGLAINPYLLFLAGVP